MKEFIRIFLVVACGGTLLAYGFVIATFLLFGEASSFNWDPCVQISGVCVIGLFIAYLMRDKHERR